MRVIISATHRSSGKTTIAIGLCAALDQKGLIVQPFKKGPDYIDPMWLTQAAGRDCHNLDIFMMGEKGTLAAFQAAAGGSIGSGPASSASGRSISIIEGNKGFYDGLDMDGRDSTCHLARLLKSPVILTIDARGMTRGIAPLILGYQQFEPDNMIQGVILNMVASSRHEKKLKDAIEHYCGVEVIGALPAMKDIEIEQRHLGLIPVRENERLLPVIDSAARVIRDYVNLERVIDIAGAAPVLSLPEMLSSARAGETPAGVRMGAAKDEVTAVADTGKDACATFTDTGRDACATGRNACAATIRLGVARDQVFTFYYPENLAALCRTGAEIIPFNTLIDEQLPDVDGLYFGGGFPEMFLEGLSRNKPLLNDIRTAVKRGMPMYAECGGLMYLARSISCNGLTKEMVGAIPCDIEVFARPQGHGYVVLNQTGKALWSGFDMEGRGHEFHYSRVINPQGLTFAYNILRGNGIDGKHDGIVHGNIIAGYAHLHSVGVPQWAPRFVDFIRRGVVK